MRTLPKLLMTTIFFISIAGSAYAEYKLVWSDEFDGTKINSANWEHQIGNGDEYDIPGWGNRELEYYTARPENSYVKDGCLVIQALKEKYSGFDYTSARLCTSGKRDFLYGKIEARIKLPSGQGMWPAFWMMPTDGVYGGWAASGEVDILEAVNYQPDRIMGSIFFGGPWPDQEHISRFSEFKEGKKVDLSADFHIYSLEWQPYEMRWSMDGKVYSVQNEWRSINGLYPAPFDKRFHFLLNIAVGGTGPGAPDKTTKWPQRMYVDWVRVYQTGNKPPAVKILSPAHKAKISADTDIVIRVKASDPDGDLDRVEFYNDNELIGTDLSAPYSFKWAESDGCYTIKVKAVDKENFVNWTTVEVVKGIGCPQLPFHGKPATIPGKIEAEDFDAGIKGESYWDNDKTNKSGAYRTSSEVDIGPCDEGGYSVGWTEKGEWLEYTVNVATSGTYNIRCRVASLVGAGAFHIEFDSADKTAGLTVPKSGGWQKFTDVIAYNVELSAGEQVMRVVIDKGEFNFNYLDITASKQDNNSGVAR